MDLVPASSLGAVNHDSLEVSHPIVTSEHHNLIIQQSRSAEVEEGRSRD